MPAFRFNPLLLAVLSAVCLTALPVYCQDLAAALDNPGKSFAAGVTPHGLTPWTTDAAVTRDGVLSARSGVITHNQDSSVITSFTGPGTLSFWWKVSSEPGWDKLYLIIDGVESAQISGEQNWARLERTLAAGTHTVEWRYAKDGSESHGSDSGWVDEVAFTPPAGDTSQHIDGRISAMGVTSSVLIYTDPARDAFRASITVPLQRLDEVPSAPVTQALPVKLTWTVEDLHTGVPVAVSAGDVHYTVNLATHRGGAQPLAATAVLAETFSFNAGANLSVDPSWSYRLRCEVSYTGADGNPVSIGTIQQDNVRLLTVSGRLAAGTVEARFSDLAWSPGTLAPEGAGYTFDVDSPPDTCWLVESPATRFRLFFQTVWRDPNSGDLHLRPGIPVVLGTLQREAANVRYAVENATLSPAGFTGSGVRVTLPSGMGLLPSATARLADAELFFPAALIQPDGTPSAPTLTHVPGGTLYVTHEQLPVRFRVNELIWNVAAGTFSAPLAFPAYERERETGWLSQDLGSGVLNNPASAVKASNEAIYRRTNQAEAMPLSIAAAPGGAGVLTASVELGSGVPGLPIAMHFPADTALPVSGGRVVVTDGAFDAASFVSVTGTVNVPYERNCTDKPECGLTNAPATPLAVTLSQNMQITPDGGWRAAGTAGSGISWGGLHGAQPTHAVSNFTSVSLHVPGTQLAAGGATATPAENQAAALLLSGMGNAAAAERPLTSGYAQGLLDYAGINLRGPALAARSHLAGRDTGNYTLKAHSRFNVRRAGVTGVHDAVTATFPRNLALYGYATQLDGLRLSFLDSRNLESATAGSITLPFPAGFSTAFQKLSFTCGGNLDRADLDSVAPVNLAFWGCGLTPRFLSFTPQRPDACTTATSYLTLGGEFDLGTVSSQKVHGALAFLPDGNIAPPSLNLAAGVDGSLPAPADLAVQGRGSLTYRFTPATRLRFVNYGRVAAAVPPAPAGGAPDARAGAGWLFAAGTLDVPFFEDMQVLLHLLPAKAVSTHVMGGWPTDRGWNTGGAHYFNDARFDADSISAPDVSSAAALAAFRSGGPAFANMARARKDWRGIVKFDFPLQWDAAGRQFRSAGNPEQEFLVLKTEAQVRSLDASGADMVFGASFAGLPKATAQLLSRALDPANSLLPGSPDKQLADSMARAFANVISTAALREGRKAMDELLDDSLSALADARVREAGRSLAASPAFATMHSTLRNFHAAGGMAAVNAQWDGASAAFRAEVQASLSNQLLLSSAAGQGLLKEVNDRLTSALTAVNVLIRLSDPNQPIAPGPAVVDALASTHPFLQAWVRRLMEDTVGRDYVALVSNGISAEMTKLLGEQMNELRPVLRRTHTTLLETKKALEEMKRGFAGLSSGARDLHGVLIAVTGAASAELAGEALAALRHEIVNSRDAGRDWFGENNVAAMGDHFARLLVEKFHASSMSAEFRRTLHKLVEPVRQQFHYALDALFSAVNSMVTDLTLRLVEKFADYLASNPNPALSSLLAGGAEAFKGARDVLGDFPEQFGKAVKTLEFAKIGGHVRTKGDTLEELRFDASIGIAVPDQIGASGFVLIRNLDRDTPSTSCRDAGVVATEVTLGASGGVKMSRKKDASSNPREMKNFAASMEGRFSLNGDLVPNGFDGMVFFQSDIDLGAITFKEAKLRLGLGGDEAYATAAAKGSVWFIEADANLFMGRTRQLSILRESFAPEVMKDVIAPLPLLASGSPCLRDPVTGVYGGVGGYLSVNRFFGIPDTCLLRLKAGRQMAQYILVTEPGAGTTINAGIRDALDIKGDVLCLGVSGQAGLLFNVSVNAGQLASEGFGAAFESVNVTARGWAEGCVDYLIGKECARVDIIVGVKPNPALAPPLIFYPIRIEY